MIGRLLRQTSTAAVMAVAAVLPLSAGDAMVQASSSPPASNKPIVRLGDSCDRRTDKEPGKVKRDACGRWYCGMAKSQDVMEINPTIATQVGCTWQVVGDFCRCIKPGTKP